MSAGDYDMALCAVDLGVGAGKFCRLKLLHLMPAARLTEEYLSKLWRAVHCSGKVMRFLRSGNSPRFHRSAKQRLYRMLRVAIGGRRSIHFRFGVAAENGLRDADNIIASFATRQK
jgi:hypothetical protein